MLPVRGCHPLWQTFPGLSGHILGSAGPRSLAATGGVSVDILSSGYLDVSVPRVRSFDPMYSGQKYLFHSIIDHAATAKPRTGRTAGAKRASRSDNNAMSGGLPHSEIRGSMAILASPRLIAEYHVLHRLLLPRHPPNALLALDLIQEKTGSTFRLPASGPSRPIAVRQRHVFACDARPFAFRAPEIRSILSRSPGLVRPEGTCGRPERRPMVSVLDLDSHMPCLRSWNLGGSRAHCPDRHDD
jgi:hypothetical protein